MACSADLFSRRLLWIILAKLEMTLSYLDNNAMVIKLLYLITFSVRDDGSLRGGHKKPKDDTFGMNDEDWMVYRHIVRKIL